SAERVVDIAGGSGGVAIGLCQELPHLFVTVVDLPSVVPTARQMVSEAALADRITVETADLLEQPFSGRFDIAIARALFQLLSAENCEIAARNIAAAIPCGGELFVIGHVLDDSGLSPENSVAQNVVFLNFFDEGQAYKESQYRHWLTNAGFVEITRKPESQGRSLITARKA
ncbi:MAG: methyltransferase, partial [Alphaproteobacteria bacterium]